MKPEKSPIHARQRALFDATLGKKMKNMTWVLPLALLVINHNGISGEQGVKKEVYFRGKIISPDERFLKAIPSPFNSEQLSFEDHALISNLWDSLLINFYSVFLNDFKADLEISTRIRDAYVKQALDGLGNKDGLAARHDNEIRLFHECQEMLIQGKSTREAMNHFNAGQKYLILDEKQFQHEYASFLARKTHEFDFGAIETQIMKSFEQPAIHESKIIALNEYINNAINLLHRRDKERESEHDAINRWFANIDHAYTYEAKLSLPVGSKKADYSIALKPMELIITNSSALSYLFIKLLENSQRRSCFRPISLFTGISLTCTSHTYMNSPAYALDEANPVLRDRLMDAKKAYYLHQLIQNDEIAFDLAPLRDYFKAGGWIVSAIIDSGGA